MSRRAWLAGAALLAALTVAVPARTGELPPLPDLVIADEAARVAWERSDEGLVLAVDVTVRNDGDRESAETTVVVDAEGAGWAVVEDRRPVGPIAAKGSKDVRFVFRPPEGDRGQTRTLVFTVDPPVVGLESEVDVVDESNEENNTTPVSVTVPHLPDLVVSAARASRTRDTLRVTADVANTGEGRAEDVVVGVELPAAARRAGWGAVRERVGALEPGAPPAPVALTVAVPPGAAGDDVTFDVVVDPDRAIVELNEDNNRFPLEVAGVDVRPEQLPNLTVSLVRARASAARRLAVVEVEVANAGRVAASDVVVRVEAPSPWKGERTARLPAVAPDDPVRRTFRFGVPRGEAGQTRTVAATVDPGRAIEESDEGDNRGAREVRIPELAELRPATPTGEVSGDRLRASVVVRNAGEEPARRVGVRFRLRQPATRAASVIEVIPPGESRSVTAELAIPEATRGTTVLLVATVDPRGRVPEGDERNNRAEVELAIPAAGDDGRDWLVPALIAAALLATLAALGARWLPRRVDGPQPEPVKPDPPVVPERPVEVGFAPTDAPYEALPSTTPLAPGTPYLFWVDVGPPVLEGGGGRDARLAVTVFSLTGFELGRGAAAGEITLGRDGAARVTRQPAEVGVPAANGRLFLEVRTPAAAGRARLRCSFYHRDVLVQSRLVTADVGERRARTGAAVGTVVDYTLAPSLDPSHLARLPQHRLSVLLNRSDDGTHGLTFRGEGEFTAQASVGAGTVTDLIGQARRALRHASWGDEGPWEGQKRYLYEDVDRERLRRDLVSLARKGFRFYQAIVQRLDADRDEVDRLEELMRRPGLVQVATKEEATHLLPAALVYDSMGFRTTGRDPDAYGLCRAFLDSLDGDAPLERTPCFEGDCPSRGEPYTVCPSGFWGFRHSLGLPVSIRGAPDAATEIPYDPAPTLVVAVSTQDDLVLRTVHEQALRKLLDGDDAWRYADSQAETLRLLKEERPHLVYFYCHGGYENGVSYIHVGPSADEPITSDVLFSERIRWDSPRPLVFINGCRTTALEPEQALEFVSFFVRTAGAAGVVGTEITIFEPLARAFAEACLQRFLGGAPLGEAVRSTRLALLKDGNPLGLAYIPFSLASLQLVGRRVAEPPTLMVRA